MKQRWKEQEGVEGNWKERVGDRFEKTHYIHI